MVALESSVHLRYKHRYVFDVTDTLFVAFYTVEFAIRFFGASAVTGVLDEDRDEQPAWHHSLTGFQNYLRAMQKSLRSAFAFFSSGYNVFEAIVLVLAYVQLSVLTVGVHSNESVIAFLRGLLLLFLVLSYLQRYAH